MATYNRAEYILETIESIRNQTYQKWELIIIDDGSDDDTEKIITGLHDERIQYHQAGRTGMVSKIKNIAIGKSSGEFLAFIDSDDLWAADKLEKQVTALDQFPEAGFSITGGYNFIKPAVPLDYFFKQHEGIKYGDVFISFFRSELPAYTQALMLRKSCIEVGGLFNETSTFSDVDFILNLARHFKAVILYETLVYRRLHETNDNKLNWEKRYEEGIEIIISNKKNLPKRITRNALFRLCINFGEDLLLHKQRKKAIYQFIKAWKIYPYSVIPYRKTAKAILSCFIK